jgi:uncharacterized OB-fold protein
MMKTKCIHCGEIYQITSNACPACGKQGGYLQTPSMKKIETLEVHLEEVLIHKESANQYQIKEIQNNGLVCTIHFNMISPGLIGKRVYISNNDINEYRKLK